MKVNSINNYSNQSNYKANPQFQARFSKAALNNMVNPCDAKFMNMHEYIPKLYTLLEHFDKINPGKLAETEFLYAKNGARVGGTIMVDGRRFHTGKDVGIVNMLEKALLRDAESVRPNDRAYMPKSVYEQKWWHNYELGKTKEDIIKDLSGEGK